MNCPKCQSTDLQNRGRRNAVYPSGIIALVGLPFAMLHQASAPQDYHCNACGSEFSHRTKTAKIARMALFATAGIMLVLLALSILYAILSSS